MSMCAFDAVFPEVGSGGYRVLEIGEGGMLPAERYLMREYYCIDPRCDCRRVVVHLMPASGGGRSAAVISYGWETASFYRKWSNAPGDGGRGMCGAALERLSEQGPHAEDLLQVFEELEHRDPAVTAHFRRQYRKVKELVKSPGFKAPRWK